MPAKGTTKRGGLLEIMKTSPKNVELAKASLSSLSLKEVLNPDENAGKRKRTAGNVEEEKGSKRTRGDTRLQTEKPVEDSLIEPVAVANVVSPPTSGGNSSGNNSSGSSIVPPPPIISSNPVASGHTTTAKVVFKTAPDLKTPSPHTPKPASSNSLKSSLNTPIPANNNKPHPLDAQTLQTINDHLRNELAQVKTDLEHSERIVQMNMGRAPVLSNRFCQAEVTSKISDYEKLRQATQMQLSKIQPSNPKYAFFEMLYHLDTEVCRIVRESFSYRGFQT